MMPRSSKTSRHFDSHPDRRAHLIQIVALHHLNASVDALAHTHGPDLLARLAANFHTADAGRRMAYTRLEAWFGELRKPRRRAAALQPERIAPALRSLLIATIGQVRVSGDSRNPGAFRASMTLHPDGVLALGVAIEIADTLDICRNGQVVADFEAYRADLMAVAFRLSRQATRDALS